MDAIKTYEWLHFCLDKIIKTNKYLGQLWDNPMIKPELSLKSIIKYRQFYEEAEYLVKDVLFLQTCTHMVDKVALDNLVQEVLELMKQARSIVDDVKLIIDKDV